MYTYRLVFTKTEEYSGVVKSRDSRFAISVELSLYSNILQLQNKGLFLERRTLPLHSFTGMEKALLQKRAVMCEC